METPNTPALVREWRALGAGPRDVHHHTDRAALFAFDADAVRLFGDAHYSSGKVVVSDDSAFMKPDMASVDEPSPPSCDQSTGWVRIRMLIAGSKAMG